MIPPYRKSTMLGARELQVRHLRRPQYPFLLLQQVLHQLNPSWRLRRQQFQYRRVLLQLKNQIMCHAPGFSEIHVNFCGHPRTSGHFSKLMTHRRRATLLVGTGSDVFTWTRYWSLQTKYCSSKCEPCQPGSTWGSKESQAYPVSSRQCACLRLG